MYMGVKNMGNLLYRNLHLVWKVLRRDGNDMLPAGPGGTGTTINSCRDCQVLIYEHTTAEISTSYFYAGMHNRNNG